MKLGCSPADTSTVRDTLVKKGWNVKQKKDADRAASAQIGDKPGGVVPKTGVLRFARNID